MPVMQPVVLDTNVVLDLWLFQDPQQQWLVQRLENGAWQWLATPSMREELARVLTYGHLSNWLTRNQMGAEAILARFDEAATLVAAAPKALFSCQDPDDQKFIDLAVAHKAWLFSKDKAVLCMKKRLGTLGCVLNPQARTR